MPALSGEVISTIRDGAGAIVIQVVIFFNPATGALVNNTYVTSSGPQTGAIVADNQTTKTQRISVKDAAGNVLRSVNIKPTDKAFTAAQCAAAGFSTITDVNGLTFDLA